MSAGCSKVLTVEEIFNRHAAIQLSDDRYENFGFRAAPGFRMPDKPRCILDRRKNATHRRLEADYMFPVARASCTTCHVFNFSHASFGAYLSDAEVVTVQKFIQLLS